MSAGPSSQKPTSSRKRPTESGSSEPRKRTKAKVPGSDVKRLGDHLSGLEPQRRVCQYQIPVKTPGVRHCFVCSARRGTRDECRFKNIRSLAWIEDAGVRRYTGVIFTSAEHQSQSDEGSPRFEYPREWNEEIGEMHLQGLMDVIASSLLPTLEKELDAFTHPAEGGQPIWRAMERECRPTCDGCNTSIFCGSYMCTLCGREVCEDCLERVRAAVGSGRPEDYPNGEVPRIVYKHYHADLKSVLSCFKNVGHHPMLFRRTSRFTKAQLQRTVDEMRARVDASAQPAIDVDERPQQEPSPPQPDAMDVDPVTQPAESSLAGTSSGATSLANSPSPSGSDPSPTAIELAKPALALSKPAIAAITLHAAPTMSVRPLTPSPTPPPATPTPQPTSPTTIVAQNPHLFTTLLGDYSSETSSEAGDRLEIDRDATPVPVTPTTPVVDDTPPLSFAESMAAAIAEGEMMRVTRAARDLADGREAVMGAATSSATVVEDALAPVSLEPTIAVSSTTVGDPHDKEAPPVPATPIARDATAPPALEPTEAVASHTADDAQPRTDDKDASPAPLTSTVPPIDDTIATQLPEVVAAATTDVEMVDDARSVDNDREATPVLATPGTPPNDAAPAAPPLELAAVVAPDAVDDARPRTDDSEITPAPAMPITPTAPPPPESSPAKPSAIAFSTEADDLPFSRAPSVLSALTEDGAPSCSSPTPAPVPLPDPKPMDIDIEPTLPPIPSHATPTFKESDANWTEAHFRELWAQGQPIVVTDLLHKFNIQWTPEYFIANYGSQPCKLVECQSEREEDRVVADFFHMLGRTRDANGDIWKLKDWPPQTDFKSDFPELYRDFEDAVPMPSYTRRDGVFNIASHFPKNALKPDLGPKMYNAFATFEGAGSKGSTRLHMDVADAVNIMLWSQRPPEDESAEPPCAAWDIFRAEDADRLRELMREHFEDADESDPIHSQKYYLDEDVRREFAEKGVWSHRILQKAGEAVFIPAGCAHQVCNLADCIKVAADFVSPENISRCAQLTQEFRRLNFAYHWKEDVLQLRTMMWFAWESCSRRGLVQAKEEGQK